MEYYKKVDTDTELSSKEKLHKSKLLTAKMAREITNEAIRKKIQDNLLPIIKNAAEKGNTNIDFDISTNIDYKFAIDYIKYLGYNIMYIKNYSSYVTIKLAGKLFHRRLFVNLLFLLYLCKKILCEPIKLR